MCDLICAASRRSDNGGDGEDAVEAVAEQEGSSGRGERMGWGNGRRGRPILAGEGSAPGPGAADSANAAHRPGTGRPATSSYFAVFDMS